MRRLAASLRIGSAGSHTAARLRILAAAGLFSTGGAAIKACALTGWQVASLRSGVAAIAVLVLLPMRRPFWSLRAVGVGAVYAATMISFVVANKLTTSASTIFLQSTAPLYILLLGPLLLKEPIRRRDLTYMGALAVGLVMLLSGVDRPAATAPNPFAGNLVATASGLFWAFTVVGFRWIGREGASQGAPGPAVVFGNAIACLVCLPLALPIASRSVSDYAVIAYLGTFQIGLAYAFLTSSFGHIPALEASLLLYLEPVLNPIWAWLVQGEKPGPWTLAGGSIILAATAAKTWFDVRSGRVGAADIPPGESGPVSGG